MSTPTAYDATDDPTRAFINALPDRIRNTIHPTDRIIILIHRAIHDHGWTPAQLAERCQDNLGANPGGTITYRLARDSQHPPPTAPRTPPGIPFCTAECRNNAGWILDNDGQPRSRCECRKAAADAP